MVLNAGTVHLLGGSSIQSQSQTFNPGLGRGGNVTIQGLSGAEFGAAELVAISGGSSLLSETFGSGEGGRVAITSKSLTMDGPFTTVSTSANSVGRGGDVVVSVQRLSVVGGAAIASTTFSSDEAAADAGTVTVQGLKGSGSKASSVLLSGQHTGIVSDSAFGVPGDFTVNAGTLTITNGAVIAAGSSTSTGPGGAVTVTADSIGISAGGQIFSRSFAQGSGQVAITANALTLNNGSIDTSTASESGGRGGNVVIQGGTVSLTNGASITSQSEGFSTGRAGDITMTVGSLTLANESVITSSSTGPVVNAGDAGTITIQSGSTVVMNNSSITAEAIQASGGEITITAPEMVRLTNSRINTSVFGGTGSGGNITIDPQFVILQNSQILAHAVAGLNGNISIDFGVFLVDPNSVVAASGQLSLSGTIQNVGGQLSPLPQQFTSAAALLLAERCAADPTGQFSSFIQTGRDGVPQIPGALSPSPLSFLETLSSGSLGSPVPNVAATRLGLDSVRFDDSTRFLSACRS